jgi:predicted DNA-binding transcriptional regulator YafY
VELVRACSGRQRVVVGYRSEAGTEWSAEVDPWAVVVRHGRWYLLCHSHGAHAPRTYRLDRIRSVRTLETTFEPPDGLDPVAALEDNLASGWEYRAEVLIDAAAAAALRWVPRAAGRVEPVDADTCRLVGTTSNPSWYAERLAGIPVPYRIVGGPELRAAARDLAGRLLDAAGGREEAAGR